MQIHLAIVIIYSAFDLFFCEVHANLLAQLIGSPRREMSRTPCFCCCYFTKCY
ncbi:hypothetical protein N431DRAFT_15338 [Stipitochalara longipes BDJ]|nr:hypothetical protein N431DRAFT_15338 [Stipitochalara longipes BDJ]